MIPKIEILSFKKVNDHGNLRGFVDIQLDQITIREFRIIHEDGKRPWVSSPQVSFKDGEGRIQYKTIVTFPDETKELVNASILNHYRRELENSANGKD